MRQSKAMRSSHFVLLLLTLLLCGQTVSAQEKNEDNPLRQGAATESSLKVKQARLADRYDQLELLAGRLAELSRSTQPRRARLLHDLIVKSRERDVAGRFDKIVGSLENDSLGKASTEQVALQAELQKLLDLLLQEDRDRQIESERKRVQKYLAEVKRLIRMQRGIKARTDGGDQPEKIAKDQRRLAKATEDLEKQIEAIEGSKSEESKSSQSTPQESGDQKQDKNDQPSQKSPEKSAEDASEQGEKSSPLKKNTEDKKGTPSPDGEKSTENMPKSSDPGKDSQSGKPAQPTEGNSSESSAAPESQSQQPQSPTERAQQKLKQAQQRMQQALDKLEKAKNEKAIEKQAEALRELEQAKAELEKILRQLREEELERMLVLLEARFRKMLNAQVEIYDQTKKLEASVATVPEHEIEIACGRLARQERQIVREANRALVLLREDGTTVAFPEAIEQARDDMTAVAKRLGEVKIGIITQGLEEDIITSLEETLAALQQALEETRDKKSQPPSKGSGGGSSEQALVDQLAELRMIRALQNRVNRRTKRYGEILGDQPAIENDLLEALDQLALRQERIFRATRDLDSGRNK